jgi:hypothetical protein
MVFVDAQRVPEMVADGRIHRFKGFARVCAVVGFDDLDAPVPRRVLEKQFLLRRRTCRSSASRLPFASPEHVVRARRPASSPPFLTAVGPAAGRIS